MRWLDRIERRAGWLAFPGLFRFFTLLGVLAFALTWMRPDLAQLLDFNRDKVFAGELWRMVTFPFAPGALRSFSPVGIIFLYFAVMIAFLVNDSLESLWGVFRTSLFLYTGFFCLLLGNLLLPATGWSGGLLYASAFLAFATHFPRHEFLLLFILPVQVRFFAIIMVVGLVLNAIAQPQVIPFLLLALLNYLLWVGIPFLRNRKALAKAAVRRSRFEKSMRPEDPTFHRCEVCGRTENDPARLDFRVAADGNEYCGDHLPGTDDD